MAIDRERIRKQAKAVMDEFVKALDKIGVVSGEVGIERDEQTRAAKATKQDSIFRERMLGNAPKKDGSHIIAEKKSW
ncbi:hypothetical protein HYU20_03385 [Candidatus Woesearchaeota archaeon]|nr:hypothetical protein [Candidatus Woesearchaeota archaeon]